MDLVEQHLGQEPVKKSTDDTVFQLPNFEFQEPSEIATPNEVPDNSSSHREIPLEIKRSATVEALISQQDDLVARLKVSLRRLSLLENENDRLRQLHRVIENKNTTLGDQNRVWEEKQELWRNKERKLESLLEDFKTRLPEYEGLSEKLDRYKKYHERIKTQVKPFIHQLKAYADSLLAEIQKLNAELAEKDAAVESLRADKNALLNENDRQRHQAESRQELLVGHFERTLQQSRQEISELQTIISRLEERSQAFDQMRAREDELSNVVVALRRQKQDIEREHLDKQNELLGTLAQTRSELTTVKEAQADQGRKVLALESENTRLSHHNQQLEEQLASLRYVWNSKSDELEKTRASLSSMERLNADLSRQLTLLRQASETESR